MVEAAEQEDAELGDLIAEEIANGADGIAVEEVQMQGRLAELAAEEHMIAMEIA